MERKRGGKICREAAVSPALVTARLTGGRKFYSMKSANYVCRAGWHGVRMVNRGGKAMGVAETSGPGEF